MIKITPRFEVEQTSEDHGTVTYKVSGWDVFIDDYFIETFIDKKDAYNLIDSKPFKTLY